MKQVPRSRSPRRVGNSDQDRVLFHFMLICDNSKNNIIVFVAHVVENLHVSISWQSEVEFENEMRERGCRGGRLTGVASLLYLHHPRVFLPFLLTRLP